MTKKKPFTVKDAYALETPADSVRLYGDWADTYDSEFVQQTGYILYQQVAAVFLQYGPLQEGPVLDIGCGTGLVGVELQGGGVKVIDGVDISKPMLDEAGRKTSATGDSVYRNLIEADLTETLPIDTDVYAGLISAGTFTLGHVGPEALPELWRVAAPGALFAIGVRTTHYETAGFEAMLAGGVADGAISQPDLVEIPIYSEDADNKEHSDDRVFVVVCRATR